MAQIMHAWRKANPRKVAAYNEARRVKEHFDLEAHLERLRQRHAARKA
jgi:hypothetical protein